jgi:DNA (cytosine-5)-methyltransferase 1
VVTVYDTTQITSPLNYSNPKSGDPCHPLAAQQHPPLCVGNGQLHQMSMAEQSNTLDCMHDQRAILMQGEHPRKYIVRRLTPLECCRLQGFPDWWEDGVEGSDSARYKMWGNGIALPCAADVLGRIAKELKRRK